MHKNPKPLFLSVKSVIINYFRSMLSAKNIYKRYGQLEVLKGVDINNSKWELRLYN